MRVRVIVISWSLILLLVFKGNAQEENTPAAQLAHRIANKMKDSLNLSNQQTAKIFVANMDLHRQKAQAMSKPTGRPQITSDLQRIENSRDTLYKTILSTAQFNLYLEKKRNLVNSQ